jgi:hypothetical protein
MLQPQQLTIGAAYDLVYRNGNFTRCILVEIRTRELNGKYYTYELFFSNYATVRIDDIGIGRYCEIYPEGVGVQVHEIRKCVKDNRLKLKIYELLQVAGYNVDSRSMGSGGVGQVRLTRKEIRIQVGAAYTKWGRAMCVVIERKDLPNAQSV